MMNKLTEKQEILNDFGQIVKVYESELEELIHKKNEIPLEIFDATKFILEEIIDLYKSIIILYENDHVQSCLLIVRPILESCINLLYIFQKDTEQRSNNFLIHPGCSLLKNLEEMECEAPGKTEMIAAFRQINNGIKRSGNCNNYWDGKTFKAMCEELEENEIYRMWYTRLSKYTHSQYRNRNLSWKHPYGQFIKDLLTKKMILLSLQALKSINEKYNLLEGGMIIDDYPHKGAIVLFSISSKEVDEQAAKESETPQKSD